MDAINEIAERHDLLVIDDAACAFGSRNRDRPVGSLAPITIFSLHARKVVTTGEGGMIVTNDGDFAERLRRLRHQGMSLSDFERHGLAPTTYESYPEIGYNFRITDIQAGMGLRQLDRLDDILSRRTDIAARYGETIGDHPWLRAPYVPQEMTPNWQSYMVQVAADAALSRDQVMTALHDKGVPTRRSVMASHLEAPYQGQGADLPHTEFEFRQNFQLPMHPALTTAQQDTILRALDDIK
jgi:perosamine synthetase